MSQVDAIVDKQLPLLRTYATAIDDLDVAMVESSTGPNQGHVDLAMQFKRKVQSIRHHAWLWRDLLIEVRQNQYGLLPTDIPGWNEAAVHVEDLLDSVIANCAAQSGMASCWIKRCGEMDVYFQVFLDSRMGGMLYVLTIASVLLMPIQTMTGIYSTEFVDAEGITTIPILKWKWGYVYFWLCAVVLPCFILIAVWSAGMLRATQRPDKNKRAGGYVGVVLKQGFRSLNNI